MFTGELDTQEADQNAMQINLINIRLHEELPVENLDNLARIVGVDHIGYNREEFALQLAGKIFGIQTDIMTDPGSIQPGLTETDLQTNIIGRLSRVAQDWTQASRLMLSEVSNRSIDVKRMTPEYKIVDEVEVPYYPHESYGDNYYRYHSYHAEGLTNAIKGNVEGAEVNSAVKMEAASKLKMMALADVVNTQVRGSYLVSETILAPATV